VQRHHLIRYAWLSIAAALVTIALKSGAYWLTNSVGLLSDALESLVNLAAAVLALAMLSIAARPPDDDHAFGHDKAEYFSSGAEGALIVAAAVGIAVAAVHRWMNPQPIEHTSVGLVIVGVSTLINFWVSQVLMRAGKQEDSITLQADAQHLLTDVWTSIGVIIGVGAVMLTGWVWLDSLIAIAIAAHIVWQGVWLVRRSSMGLLDTVLPDEERLALLKVLEKYCQKSVTYHALRTRQSGARRFVSVHILVPGEWTVEQGHTLLEKIERDMRATLPNLVISTHLEPREAPESFEDVALDRATTESWDS
jgi:cation diffusion facilitator family transporter